MKRKITFDNDLSKTQENPKDFSELLADYHAQSGSGTGSSNWIKLGLGGAAACILGLVLFSVLGSSETEQKANIPEETPTELVTSKIEVPSWKVKVSATESTILVSPKGVIIEIPEDAFASKTSNTLLDSVTLELTQFDDPASIILSQIPMTYDSLGVKYHFQSDGMFEVNGFGDNTELDLAKNLTIHYPQTTGRSSSNTYFLQNNAWTYQESTEMSTYDEVCKETIYRFSESPIADSAPHSSELADLKIKSGFLSNEIEKLELQRPLEPKKQNLSNYRFTLDVKPSEFPELTKFDDVVFEVKDSRFTWSIYEETWNDISVKRSPKEGRYLVTLKNTNRLEIFDVYPVLDEAEFAEAFSDYSNTIRQIEEQKKDLTRQLAENDRIEQQFLADIASYKQESKPASKRDQVINALTANLTADTPYRSVELGSFCAVNFDIGFPLPAKGYPVQADFVIAQNATTVNAVSLIDLEDNIYYTFTQAEYAEFRYLKGKQHAIISVLSNGEIAIYQQDLNSPRIKKGQPYRFELDMVSIESLDELRDLLGMELGV